GAVERLDLVGDETLGQLAHLLAQFDAPSHRQFSWWIPRHHPALRIDRTVRHAQHERTANPRLEFDAATEKILPRELGIGESGPHLHRRAGDIGDVDCFRHEARLAHGGHPLALAHTAPRSPPATPRPPPLFSPSHPPPPPPP